MQTERVNANQEQAVSNILSSSEHVDYWSEVERLQKSKEDGQQPSLRSEKESAVQLQKPEEGPQQLSIPSQQVMASNTESAAELVKCTIFLWISVLWMHCECVSRAPRAPVMCFILF